MFRVAELKGEAVSAYEAALMERREWLEARGEGMWKPEHLNIRGMVERYGSPSFYGAFEAEEFLGGFTLIEVDERYWPGRSGDAAFYFHKFVVRPICAGRGYADRILRWVKAFAAEKGKDFVRLDYEKRRSYLRSMYLRNGFGDRGELRSPAGALIVLAECPVGSGARPEPAPAERG